LNGEELKKDLFIHVNSFPYKLIIDRMLPCFACFDSDFELHAIAHPIVALISDGCAPDESEMEEIFS
jgi:hypothetical protein